MALCAVETAFNMLLTVLASKPGALETFVPRFVSILLARTLAPSPSGYSSDALLRLWTQLATSPTGRNSLTFTQRLERAFCYLSFTLSPNEVNVVNRESSMLTLHHIWCKKLTCKPKLP